ncbi:3-hydroxybutyryl-CoA dehydrogenase [Heliorestis convoluta]|uniref:3-hydroxybutyryl-CoA dehydrogenase n=1 Tax=Heliorestis convoluta TaxID=356322 RepID=A0A5Q2N5C3_9FIRM|nr:3-hydroxybutyryl-CoA dehydrogenase [Heliorestis convoluta]QGG47440.1 3-hydroxybutyryl-CoA dehydrogenase [Heliorestis convoluta]
MNIEKVLVIGAGQMGSGIAQVAAQAGLQVYLYDIHRAAVTKGRQRIEKSLSKFVSKGKLREDEKEAILARIQDSTSLEDAAHCQCVIEAAVEKMEIKKKIFQEVDQWAPQEAILASNTSSLPITALASYTERPDRVIGMHFMNPVPVMRLVEIIRGLATSDETYDAIANLTEKMGKVAVSCKDIPGFISNRVLQVMINEAIWCYYEGAATADGIDSIMKLGMNHPMGPLELADLIGLDTVLAILEVLQEGYGDPKYRPCPLLRQYVQAGYLGRKTGRGFYNYEA